MSQSKYRLKLDFDTTVLDFDAKHQKRQLLRFSNSRAPESGDFYS